MGNTDACSRVPTQRVIRLEEQYCGGHGPVTLCCRKHSEPQVQHISPGDEADEKQGDDGSPDHDAAQEPATQAADDTQAADVAPSTAETQQSLKTKDLDKL